MNTLTMNLLAEILEVAKQFEEPKKVALELKKAITKQVGKIKMSTKSENRYYIKKVSLTVDFDGLGTEQIAMIKEIACLYAVNLDYISVNGATYFHTSSEYIKELEYIKAEEERKAWEAEAEAEAAAREAEYKQNVKVEGIAAAEVVNVEEKNIFVNALEPSLNKNNWKSDNDAEVAASSRLIKYKITDIVTLSVDEYNYFCYNLLESYDFLTNKGGSEVDEEYYKQTGKYKFLHGYAVLVIAPGCEPLVIDPQGYDYARYTNKFVSIVEDSENTIKAAQEAAEAAASKAEQVTEEAPAAEASEDKALKCNDTAAAVAVMVIDETTEEAPAASEAAEVVAETTEEAAASDLLEKLKEAQEVAKTAAAAAIEAAAAAEKAAAAAAALTEQLNQVNAAAAAVAAPEASEVAAVEVSEAVEEQQNKLSSLKRGEKYTLLGCDGCLDYNMQITLLDFQLIQWAQYAAIPLITYKKKGGKKEYKMYLTYKFTFLAGWHQIENKKQVSENVFKLEKYNQEDYKSHPMHVLSGYCKENYFNEDYDYLIDKSTEAAEKYGFDTTEYTENMKKFIQENDFSINSSLENFLNGYELGCIFEVLKRIEKNM